MVETNYEDAFELTGHGKFSYVALLACGLIFTYTSMEMTAIAYIITPAECDLHFSTKEKSLVNSAVFIGIMLTAICWGLLSDRYGRRKIMLPAVIGTVVASFFSSLCSEFWPMFTLRLLVGVLVSASSAPVLVYLGELHTNSYRDTAVALVITADQFNFAFVPGVAWIIVPGKWSFHLGPYLIKSWRVFMWYWYVAGIAGAALLFILPESPRFILATQGPLKTLPILAQMYSWNTGKRRDEYPVTSMKTLSRTSLNADMSMFAKTVHDIRWTMRKPLRLCFMLSHFAMFLVYILTNGIYIWMPGIINEMLKNFLKPSSVCDLIVDRYMQSGELWFEHVDIEDVPLTSAECELGEVKTLVYPLSMAMEGFHMLPYLIVCFVIHKFSHVKIYAFIMCGSALALAFCCVVKQITTATIFLILSICCGSTISIISAITMDVIPTKLRALSICSLYMCGQLGTVVGISVINLMHTSTWCSILFYILVLSMIASAFLLVKFWPDEHRIRILMEEHNFTY